MRHILEDEWPQDDLVRGGTTVEFIHFQWACDSIYFRHPTQAFDLVTVGSLPETEGSVMKNQTTMSFNFITSPPRSFFSSFIS